MEDDSQFFSSLFASLRKNFDKSTGSAEALRIIRDVDIDDESKSNFLVNMIHGKLSEEFQQTQERRNNKIKSLQDDLVNALWALQREQLEFRVKRAEKAMVHTWLPTS